MPVLNSCRTICHADPGPGDKHMNRTNGHNNSTQEKTQEGMFQLSRRKDKENHHLQGSIKTVFSIVAEHTKNR
jgi:hypothetical protein